MTERTIFLTAIEIADLTKRAAYLDQACGGNAKLRAQVDALLSSHQQSSQFLETPASAQDSAVERTLVSHAPDEGDDDHNSAASTGEAELRKYLRSSTRPGWLGRLAHYEIEQILGRGAFGIVAKAYDEKLHRVVAIKLMNPDLASTSAPRKRFLREARTAAAVRHDNIVGIHAVEEEPLPYLVMEYIPGITLQQRLDQNGPLETPEILRIGQQVAAGLAAAHAANLIHRDIKPSNILLEGGIENRAKISDFGLARAVDDASLTSSGLIAGTPMYMAPEQARGEILDHRADLFSLGSVLYHMTSGRAPFRAPNTIAVLKRVCDDTPRPIEDVIPGTPDWLCTIITRLLQKQPSDRYQTAKEVADLFARCQAELQLSGKVTCVQSSHHSTSDELSTAALPTSSRPSPQFTPAAAKSAVLLSKTTPAGSSRRSETATLGNRRWLITGVIAALAIAAVFMLNNRRNNRTATLVSEEGQPSETNTEIAIQKSKIETPLGWHGWPADAPAPAIAPFDAVKAKQHQQAWADYLKIPVEHTNSIGMKFVLIPPGEFTMGSTLAEIEAHLKAVDPNDKHWQECIKSEAPQHKVILTQAIYLGVNEVTQADYEQVMETNPSHFAATGPGKEAVGGIDTSRHPVESVSWNDAAEFCAKLSQKDELKPFYFRSGETITPLDGTGYRLPTEAEWEFACRAGTTTKYWISDKDQELIIAAWFGVNSGGRTFAIGQLQANPLGLYDIHGNVWEWVQDTWNPASYDQFSEKPAINPNAPSSDGSQRVIRGGNWFYPAFGCRSSDRRSNDPTTRNDGIGFRVALVAMSSSVGHSTKLTGPAMTKPVSDTDRRAAEWVLSIGGTGMIRVADKDQEFQAAKDLPAEPFQVVSIVLARNQQVSDAGLVHLKGLTKLTHLNLNETKVTDAGLEHLKGLTNLTTLALYLTRVSDAGLEHVEGLTNLVVLQLGGTPVSDAGLEHLQALTDLAILDLQRTKVSDAGLAHVEGLTNLTNLLLNYTQVSDAGLEHLKGLTNLVVLDLSATQVTDAGLEHLKALTKLTDLNLHGTQVSDAGLEHLKGLTRLTDLNLHSTQVSDAGLEHLKSLTNLQTLVLAYTKVTDAGLEQLQGLTKLTKLILVGTQVTDAGLEHLQGLINLTYLDLENTQVSDAGLEQLVSLPNLTALALRHTRISAKGFATLKAAFPNAEIIWSEPNRIAAEAVIVLGGTVQIRLKGQQNDQPVNAVADLPTADYQVTRVSLAGVQKPLDEVWPKLMALSDPTFDHLEAIDLSGSGVNDSQIPGLKSLTSLIELSLTGTSLTDAGLDQLKDVKSLRHLVLDGCPINGTGFAVTNNAPDQPQAFTSLTDLSLARTQMNDANLAHLKDLKSLHRLILDGCTIRGTGLTHLKELPNLAELSLGCPTLTDVFANRLTELPQVQKLSLAGSGLTDEAIPSLTGLTNLQELNLSGTRLTASGIATLQAALPKCKIISEVPAAAAMTPAESERALAEWLLKQPGMGSGSMTLVREGVADALAVKAGDTLPDGPFSVVMIDLRDAGGMTDDDLAQIGKAQRLSQLALGSNDGRFSNVTDKGLANLLSPSVCKSLGLIQISAIFPNVTEEGYLALNRASEMNELMFWALEPDKGAFLSRLTGLQKLGGLSVSGQGIPGGWIEGLPTRMPDLVVLVVANGTRPTAADLQALPKLDLLVKLTLRNSGLNDEAIASIGQLRKLTFLDLAGNSEITDSGVAHLATLAELTTIGLGGTRVGDETCKTLASLDKLEEVHLDHTRVTDTGIESLIALKAIKRLNVADCKRLSDKGLESLAKMSSLTYLDIVNNPQLTEPAVRKLQAALPNCKIISDFPDK